jgi:hypothetical protein
MGRFVKTHWTEWSYVGYNCVVKLILNSRNVYTALLKGPTARCTYNIEMHVARHRSGPKPRG